MDNVNNDQNINNTVVASAVAAVIDKAYELTGKKPILVTHSQGGLAGWNTVLYTENISSIIAIEPGCAPGVNSEAYNALVAKKIPICFYYGDYIGTNFPDIPASSMWFFMRSSAYTFETSYNTAGGKCTVYDLPDEGIYGNDHMMFQDTNNDIIANHIENWIKNNVPNEGSNSFARNLSIRKLLSFMNGLLF